MHQRKTNKRDTVSVFQELKPGDYVVLNWRAVCGNCRACLRGRPQYCFATHNASQRMRLEDGTEHTVTVLHDGYDLGGKKFKSLSAVAKAITGTNWNGFRFFALGTGRKG